MLKRLVGHFVNSPDEIVNFEWCCRPVLVAINLFGIPLRMHKSENTIAIWIINIFGWILYFTNVAAGLMMIYLDSEMVNQSVNNESILNNRTTAWQWNSGISTYNNVCSTVSIQTVLLAITAVRWKDLVSVLERMERTNQFTPKELTHFRATFRLGLLVIIFVSIYIIRITVSFQLIYCLIYYWQSCSAVCSLSISAYFDAGFRLRQMIFYSFQRCFIIFICLAAVLFICFGWMAATMLQMLGKEMACFISNPTDARPSETLISKWNRRYFTIIDLVHQINRCFGCLLLVMVAPAFVRVINTSFHLMIDMKEGQWTINVTIQLVVLFANFLGFTFMANIPHRIRQEV